MTKQNNNPAAIEQDDLKAHYDFDYGKAKPNRFAARFDEESLQVVLYSGQLENRSIYSSWKGSPIAS